MRTIKFKVTEHYANGSTKEVVYNEGERLSAIVHRDTYNDTNKFNRNYATIETIVEGEDTFSDKAHAFVAANNNKVNPNRIWKQKSNYTKSR